jgi:hypothetical protein
VRSFSHDRAGTDEQVWQDWRGRARRLREVLDACELLAPTARVHVLRLPDGALTEPVIA